MRNEHIGRRGPKLNAVMAIRSGGFAKRSVDQQCSEELATAVFLICRGFHITDSVHYIQTMEPKLVIDAVQQVVDAARLGSSSAVTPDRS